MSVPSHAFQKWTDDAGVSTLRLSSAERKRIENALYAAYVAGDNDGYTRGYSEGYGTLSPLVSNLWGADKHLGLKCNCGYGGFHEPLNPRCDLYTGSE